ncbi:mechanosensitive ion channel family protein [Falsiroseomonas tokyonensis]|uniref:Small-conductance mechanosensitive channel n=1 Tax=Falsiroseomonas tokyonensis TaxID=430521 RepID=A0ABV7BP45_9PROT|nr:mechanosensitive ion channel family protein [Falsiroseomonas tokyonensis]MBU8536599.1 mechanosensitive ion channel family protein [Falsiroseomonas tokyonensis]
MMFDEALDRLQALGSSAANILPGLLLGVLVFGLGLILVRGVRAAVTRAASLREASASSAMVLGRIAGGLVTVVVFLVAAAVAFPSVSAADLFNLLGIGGVAIGFAFRDVLQNLLAGVLILLTRPFRIGDQIRHGEQEGTVEDIWVRATVLRTYDNRRILIPNASLFTDKIEVITAYQQRRLQFALTIGNGDDISLARDVVVRALRANPGVLADPAPEALVTGLGTAGVDMVARFWINPPRRRDAVDALDGAIEAVKDALTAAGLDLPFPTTQVLFHDQTEETDGDRSRQREGWPAAGRDVPRPRWQVTRKAERDPAGDRP